MSGLPLVSNFDHVIVDNPILLILLIIGHGPATQAAQRQLAACCHACIHRYMYMTCTTVCSTKRSSTKHHVPVQHAVDQGVVNINYCILRLPAYVIFVP